MNFPPKLSAQQLFWWGATFLGVGVAANILIRFRLEATMFDFEAQILRSISGAVFIVTPLLTYFGIAFIAVSLGVRALRGNLKEEPAPSGKQREITDA